MKLLVGWIAGIATAWTMLAIWRRIPPFPDIDADYAHEVDERRSDPSWTPGRHAVDLTRPWCEHPSRRGIDGP